MQPRALSVHRILMNDFGLVLDGRANYSQCPDLFCTGESRSSENISEVTVSDGGCSLFFAFSFGYSTTSRGE